MAPIRLALIGLSSSAKTAWASTAHLPYLLSPRGLAKYQIIALLNSSIEAAESAIKFYDLPPTTRAYGNPSDLAADPDVDLVVCNTRVDVHEEAIAASVEAGKAVYCEWPLASNSEAAQRLVDSAKKQGTLNKTVIGLQGRVFPLVKKLEELIESGRIGKVLSSEVGVFGGLNDRVVQPKGLEYFATRKVGGNVYTIGFTHGFDTIQSVLGELQNGAFGHFQLQHPLVKLRDADGNIIGTVKSDVPDLVLVAGTLPGSATVQKGATLHHRFRRGQAFPGEPALSWSINGEKGEIRVVSQSAANLNIGVPDDASPMKIDLYDFESGEVTPVEWEWADWQKELPIFARNIGQVYEDYAAGWERQEVRYATFEDALGRHKQLEKLIEGWRA